MSHPAFNQLLDAFACHAHLSARALRESAEIIIDTTAVAMYAESIPQQGGEAVDFIMFSTLNIPPRADEASVYRAAPEQANTLWAGTAGATLGVQPGTGALTLCARFPLSTMNAEALANHLGRFVDTAECWSDYIRSRHAAAPAPQAEAFLSGLKA